MEPPDFDQIADTIARRVESHCSDLDPERETDDDAVRATVVRAIAEQLRQVWNARGAADMKAIEACQGDAQAAARGSGRVIRQYSIDRAIESLDK